MAKDWSAWVTAAPLLTISTLPPSPPPPAVPPMDTRLAAVPPSPPPPPTDWAKMSCENAPLVWIEPSFSTLTKPPLDVPLPLPPMPTKEMPAAPPEPPEPPTDWAKIPRE